MPIRIRTPWHNKDQADRTQNVSATFISSLGDTTLYPSYIFYQRPKVIKPYLILFSNFSSFEQNENATM